MLRSLDDTLKYKKNANIYVVHFHHSAEENNNSIKTVKQNYLSPEIADHLLETIKSDIRSRNKSNKEINQFQIRFYNAYNHVKSQNDLTLDVLNSVLGPNEQLSASEFLNMTKMIGETLLVQDPQVRTYTNAACYIYHSRENISESENIYVGQTRNIASRDEKHKNSHKKTTSKYFTLFEDSDKNHFPFTHVTIYHLDLRNKLELDKLLNQYEQYLILKNRANVNRNYLSSGTSYGKEIFVYLISQAITIELVHSFPSVENTDTNLFQSPNITRNIKKYGGWYRETIYLSTELLPGIQDNFMELDNLKLHVAELKKIPGKRHSIVSVTLTSIKTNETFVFTSKIAAIKKIGGSHGKNPLKTCGITFSEGVYNGWIYKVEPRKFRAPLAKLLSSAI